MNKHIILSFLIFLLTNFGLNSYLLANVLNGKGVVCNWNSNGIAKNSYSFLFNDDDVFFYKFIFKDKQISEDKHKFNYTVNFNNILIKTEEMKVNISRKPLDKTKWTNDNFIGRLVHESEDKKYVPVTIRITNKLNLKKQNFKPKVQNYVCIITNNKNDFFKYFNKDFFLKKNIL